MPEKLKKDEKKAQSQDCAQYRFLVDQPNFPYCSGCGHKGINKALDSALCKLGRDPKQITIVSDIGCVGLVDKLFLTNTVHTTHGRSAAFAAGIELADQILFDGSTTQIVMLGDGGATIGILHLIEAARMNVNINVILHNNFLYGMTGGQRSGLTPLDLRTSTTMDGNVVPPLRLLEILEASQAGFLARKYATDKDLDDTILEAIKYPGFSCVEVVELCTGYATKWNKMGKADVQGMLEGMGSQKTGVLKKRSDLETLSSTYKNKFPSNIAAHKSLPVEVQNEIVLEKPVSLIFAGTAGEGVQFAARLSLLAAVANGLNVLQKNDNPVTVGSGFSLSEITYSSEQILYSGISVPDYILVTSEDGLNRVKDSILGASSDTILIIDQALDVPKTKAQVFKKPLRKSAKHKRQANVTALGCLLNHITYLSMKDLEHAALKSGKDLEHIMDALRMGFDLGGEGPRKVAKKDCSK